MMQIILPLAWKRGLDIILNVEIRLLGIVFVRTEAMSRNTIAKFNE